MEKRKIIFIINPNSGSGRGSIILDKINKYNFRNSTVESYLTEEVEDFHQAIQTAKDEKPDAVIAVGGDGTMNAVASSLVNTDIALGIIPIGSGNGLARDLKIPLNVYKALYKIDNPQFKLIDAGVVNSKYFFCASGIGFDAHISKLFTESETRGLGGYVMLSLKEFFANKPKNYDICINDKVYNRNAFLIVIANATQYGNNAFIAPAANLQDGILDITILKPFKFYHTPMLALRLFNKNIYNSSKIEAFKAKEITIKLGGSDVFHYDGETYNTGDEIKYSIIQKALKVLV